MNPNLYCAMMSLLACAVTTPKHGEEGEKGREAPMAEAQFDQDCSWLTDRPDGGAAGCVGGCGCVGASVGWAVIGGGWGVELGKGAGKLI